MSDTNDEDKTLEATPKRREEYRKQGKFARSRDASALATASAGLGALVAMREVSGQSLALLFERTFAHLATHDGAIPWHAATEALIALAVPCIVAASIAGIAVGLAQAGMHFNLELVAFKPDRLDPFGRLKQLVSLKNGGLEALLSLLRIGAVGFVTYRAARGELPSLLSLGEQTISASMTILVRAVTHVTVAALVSLVVLTAIDYALSRFKLEREMRMSRKEMMDEHKSEEGDPRRKAKQKQRARAMAKKRSLQNVKRAAVVVTNPTHVAVALRYEASDYAPIVVAKGHDDLALKIRAEARKHGIPILENRKLARALDAEVKLGEAVPAAHFIAVARILAYVMKRFGARPIARERSGDGTKAALPRA